MTLVTGTEAVHIKHSTSTDKAHIVRNPTSNTWADKRTYILTIVLIVFMSNFGVVSYVYVYRLGIKAQIREIFGERLKDAAEGTETDPTLIHLSVVICGERFEQGLVMLKSAVLLSRSRLIIHIFTDLHRQAIAKEIEKWTQNETGRVILDFHKPEYPVYPGCKKCSNSSWARLFRPCAAQRLFLPDLLPDVDSTIYMDTDTVFLAPVEDLWQQFSNLNSSHLFGIVEGYNRWFEKNKNELHCAKTGLCSGVMLMNLTRARNIKWILKTQEYYEKYKSSLSLGDQSLINIYCHFYPEQFYLMSCTYDYRAFCHRGTVCSEAISTGVHVLHGSGGLFTKKHFPVEGNIHTAIKEHIIGRHSLQDLYTNIVQRIQPLIWKQCNKEHTLFTRNLLKFIQNGST